MGEETTKLPRVLLVRLQLPADPRMVVQASLGHEFLERCLKLMHICQKIKRTMGGAGQVMIESYSQLYVTIHSETAIQRLVSKARAKDWESFKCLWVPADFYIGDCRLVAGVRRDTTHVDEEALWFEGRDGGRSHLESVRLSRAWLRMELERNDYFKPLKH